MQANTHDDCGYITRLQHWAASVVRAVCDLCVTSDVVRRRAHLKTVRLQHQQTVPLRLLSGQPWLRQWSHRECVVVDDGSLGGARRTTEYQLHRRHHHHHQRHSHDDDGMV